MNPFAERILDVVESYGSGHGGTSLLFVEVALLIPGNHCLGIHCTYIRKVPQAYNISTGPSPHLKCFLYCCNG